MNIQKRIDNLENKLIPDEINVCVCPDALAINIRGAPFFEVCSKCAKTINIDTWEHWKTISPYNAETNWFFLGLRRDDEEEFKDFHDSYFSRELSDIYYLWRCLCVPETEMKNIKYKVFSEFPAMSADEFYEYQNEHVKSRHSTYEEHLEEKNLLCLLPGEKNDKNK
jgi:hypothetical protein